MRGCGRTFVLTFIACHFVHYDAASTEYLVGLGKLWVYVSINQFPTVALTWY
jgi:hypothetical protein